MARCLAPGSAGVGEDGPTLPQDERRGRRSRSPAPESPTEGTVSASERRGSSPACRCPFVQLRIAHPVAPRVVLAQLGSQFVRAIGRQHLRRIQGETSNEFAGVAVIGDGALRPGSIGCGNAGSAQKGFLSGFACASPARPIPAAVQILRGVGSVTPLWQETGTGVVFWVLFGLFGVGEGVMRVRSRLNRQGTASEPWSQLIVAVSIIGGLLGGLAVALGIFVRQWSIQTLGRFFTGDVRVSGHQPVIDRGPYRWARHPSYGGLIIFFIGFGLSLTNFISLVILAVVPTAGLIARIHFEERALLATLGEPYRRYAATRKRLIPGIW
jgi:protein-S-isoprenylcysteine O-methyltransferase Ste14